MFKEPFVVDRWCIQVCNGLLHHVHTINLKLWLDIANKMDIHFEHRWHELSISAQYFTCNLQSQCWTRCYIWLSSWSHYHQGTLLGTQARIYHARNSYHHTFPKILFQSSAPQTVLVMVFFKNRYTECFKRTFEMLDHCNCYFLVFLQVLWKHCI